jgi:hypothetical protein
VVLIVVYLAAITSTHAALRGDDGAADVNGNGLTSSNQAEDGYDEILSATRPGGKATFGVFVNNKGPVPITVLSVALAQPAPSDVATVLAPAGGARLGWDFGPLTPFHPVTIGPGGTVGAAFSERVVCPTVTRADAGAGSGQPGNSGWLSEVDSPVVVRYRVLGVTMSQTLSLGSPVLVRLRASACT